MKFAEFRNGLNNGDTFSAYLFEGEDAYFRNRGLKLIKDKFLEEPDLNYAQFDGSIDLSLIEASLFSLPFLGAKRITCNKEFYPDAKTVKGFISEYLTNPPLDGILVILNEKTSDTLKKFNAVQVVDCGKQDASTLARYIKAEFNNNKVNIDGETATKLAEYCLFDMTRIEIETKKLTTYAGAGGTVDLAVLDEMVYKSAEHKIYEMTEHIGKRRYDKAISVINEMLLKNETPQRILVSVYNYFRRLLHIAISDKSNSELAWLLGVKEYAVSKSKEQAKYFKPRALKKAVDLLSETDFLIKSGKVNADETLWLAIFKIMTE